MSNSAILRRSGNLLCALLLLSVATALPARAQDRSILIPAAGGETRVEVWDAAGERPRGFILFGSGWQGRPSNYDALLGNWAAAGYSVFAPITLDNADHPGHAGVDGDPMARATAFVADRMAATSALRQWFEAREPDLPVALAGHSFGSFVALAQAEGRWAFGPLPGPEVDAVLAFSSPGSVPMLIDETTYTTLDTPMLMVTGTRDTGEATFPDWESHRLPFDRSVAGDKFLAVFDEGPHNLAAKDEDAWLSRSLSISVTFLDAYLNDNADAVTLLDRDLAETGVRIERR